MTPVSNTVRRGDALFHGKEKLRGNIRGHDDGLPPEAVRCSNCHGENRARPAGFTATPKIDRGWLLEPRPRRGGPPSRYDQASFCKLLRTGSDPAYIVIGREMPVYAVDDSQCASLWAYLLERGSENEKH